MNPHAMLSIFALLCDIEYIFPLTELTLRIFPTLSNAISSPGASPLMLLILAKTSLAISIFGTQ